MIRMTTRAERALRWRQGEDVARMVRKLAILSVLKPAVGRDKALVSIDMELDAAELSTLQSFLAAR